MPKKSTKTWKVVEDFDVPLSARSVRAFKAGEVASALTQKMIDIGLKKGALIELTQPKNGE